MVLSEVNDKWTVSNYKKMWNKLKPLYWNIQIVVTNSNDHELTDSDWLLGGLLTGIWGNVASMVDNTKIYKDKLGKWTMNHITNGSKMILLISVYRLPQSS